MRSQNRKDKDTRRLAPRQGSIGFVGATNRTAGAIGKISCLGMLGLGMMLFCPACESASALASDELASGSLTSSVSISFAPSAGSTTLSPTNAAGASGLISVLANVGVTNSGGYSVYLGSSSSNLVGKKNSSIVIPGVSGEVSFDNLQDNTWGYTATEGAVIPEGATYKAVATGQGNAIYTNNNSRVKDEKKTFALGFAAKINNSMPADTYENQVTLSVVSSPYQLTLMDIDNMQDMTSAICENSPQLSTKQLKDIRDGKYYWVTKLADNNCWMTQNLALDLGSEWPDANLSDYEVANTEYKPIATENERRDTLSDINGTHSWNFGEWVIAHPTESNNCGILNYNLSTCSAQVISVANKTPSVEPDFYEKHKAPVAEDKYDAHYLIGNYYQWNTITAGTGAEVIEDGENAQGSLCPRGWKLPTASSSTGENFSELILAGNIGNSVVKLTSAPYYFVRGGIAYPDSERLLSFVGNTGRYWTSTSVNNEAAYRITYEDTNTIAPTSADIRRYGNTTRCLAR